MKNNTLNVPKARNLKRVWRAAAPYLLAILSGVMISLGWFTPCPTLVMLVSIVPLLFAENLIAGDSKKAKLLRVGLLAFIYVYVQNLLILYPLFLMFKGWTLLFFCFNSLLYSLLFVLFSFVRRKLGNGWGYFAFVSFSVLFDFILQNIDFSFPAIPMGFMLIGNNQTGIPFMQWYEYTGVLGGSVWILAVNVLVFLLIRDKIEKKKLRIPRLSACMATIVLPIALSLLIYYTYREKKAPVEVVLVQPNFDPYTEKFTIDVADQLDRMVELAREYADSTTDVIVFPETALDSNFWYNNINDNGMVAYLRDTFLADYPEANLITGATMLEYFMGAVPPSRDAMVAGDNLFLQMYNAAFQVAYGQPVQVYKKDKLVLGTERNPFKKKWDSNFSGGQAINLARAEAQTIFRNGKAKVGCFICYESLFGDYCARFADMGADIFCTITNDGWWLDTDLPPKHLRHAQVRAIECRRSVARCGNTGVTAGIDQRGRIVAQAPWWEPTALKVTLNKNRTKTLYTQWGDYIGIISVLLFLLVITLTIYKLIATSRPVQSAGSIGKDRKS